MCLGSAPSTGRHASRRDTHRIHDELTVLHMANRMAAAGWRPATDFWVFAPVHVDVADTSAFWRQNDLVFADDEMNRARVRVDAKRPASERPGATGTRDDDVWLAGIMRLVVLVRGTPWSCLRAAHRLCGGRPGGSQQSRREFGRETTEVAGPIGVDPHPIALEPLNADR